MQIFVAALHALCPVSTTLLVWCIHGQPRYRDIK